VSDQQSASPHSEYLFTLDPGKAPARAVLEAASWRITADLVQRYPDRFMVIETHPCDGQYDCITLVDQDPRSNLSRIDLNRAGSIHVHRRDSKWWSWRGCWWQLVSDHDLTAPLADLCSQAGLVWPYSLPKPTPAVVAYRVIAAFLTHQVLGQRRWQCCNGYEHNGGWVSGLRESLFEPFPEPWQRLQDRVSVFEEPGQRFWFLLKDGEPGLAIEPAAGFAWNTKGRRSNLYARYQRTHSVWAALWSAAGHLLP